jgi:hypothetical protein
MLERRMRAILDDARPRATPRRRAVLGSAAIMAALLGVVAAAQPTRDGAPPQLTEELRIGGWTPELRFSEVDRIAVGRDGSFFVSDSGGRRLRLYDSGGRFVRVVGGRGEGPGQFRDVTRMVVTPAGELAVYDVFAMRISFYDARGTFVRSIPSRVGGNWTGNDLHADRDGNLYVFGIRYSRERCAPTEAERSRSQRFFLKRSPAGAVLNVVDAAPTCAAPSRRSRSSPSSTASGRGAPTSIPERRDCAPPRPARSSRRTSRRQEVTRGTGSGMMAL